MELSTYEALHEQYITLKASIKSDKIGTETEPGWDHSPAKQILTSMLESIKSCLEKVETPSKDHNRLLAMQGALCYQHAKVLVRFNETELAQEVLKTCIDFLKDSFLFTEITFVGLRILNHYCYLLTKCGDLEAAQEFLELAEKKYLELKESNDISALPLYSNDDLFVGKSELTPNKEINEKLERLVTNNLQMLGYVYNKQGNLDMFASYHHQVLRRQLDMREGDATVWAMKTARLGYFFLTQNKFAQARHHLAAACYVLSQYESTLKTLETTNLVLSKWDELNHRYADIAKCWVRYGLFLFNASKMKLVSAFYGDSSNFIDNSWANPFDNFMYTEQEDNEDHGVWHGSQPKTHEESLHNSLGKTNLKDLSNLNEAMENTSKKEGKSHIPPSVVFDVLFENSNPSNISIGATGPELNNTKPTTPLNVDGILPEVNKSNEEDVKKFEEAGEPNFRFPNLDLTSLENCVSCDYVDSVQSARALFLFTHSWLKKSKLFYPLKDHPMEYVNVILDLSELYRYLAFYEDDIENQYSVQKRRADTLETLSAVLKEVRPQCYIAISIELFRELAEIHLELMGLNLRRLYLSQPDPINEEDSKAAAENLTRFSEYSFQKMEAVADVHQRLYHFSEILGHGALGDSEPGFAAAAAATSSFGAEIQKDLNLTGDKMDVILDLREKYSNVRKLLEEDFKKDPETEPYKSKYQAKSILLKMKEIIETYIDSQKKKNSGLTPERTMLPVVIYQIGLICVDTEEPGEGERYFKECYDSIVDHMDCRSVLVSIHVRNQLGILWSRRSQPSEAQSWLEGAEKLYNDFKAAGNSPKHFHDLFDEEDSADGTKELEMVHTLTKFYLAQVYGVLKDLLKSAIYCHETLRRQLIHNEYDSIDWALNSATLSQFFMERLLFKQARHHLAAASCILDLCTDALKNFEGTKEELEGKNEELRHRSSDVSRCWAKYGIFLLEHSKNRLKELEEEVPVEKNENLENLWFDSLNLDNYENQIVDSDVVLYEDAREIFLFTQKHLNRAKEYYSLEDRASDHVEIVQDHSMLFRHLQAFEKDEERQCKMMRKRIEMLEIVLKELNPKYYMNVCRHLWFELGETYHDLSLAKFQKVKDAKNQATPHAFKKINNLAESSILHFNNFLDSVKDKKKNELPETLPDELVAPILIAHFYLGRLFYKYITHDRRKQIENTTKSYECFKYVVDYCDRNEKGRNALGEELNISKEMMSLLEIKIQEF